MQIPTKDYTNLSESERKIRNTEDIKKAKDVIGKVVKLEFREEKTTINDADRAERQKLAVAIANEAKNIPFATVATKYTDQYENVYAKTGTGTLPPEIQTAASYTGTVFPYILPMFQTAIGAGQTYDASGNVVQNPGLPGYAIVSLDGKNGSGTGATYQYSYIFVDERPSNWMPAKTTDGKILNDKYLVNASVGFTQVGAPQVELLFNDEGKKIFGDLTKRLVGKRIAIFV